MSWGLDCRGTAETYPPLTPKDKKYVKVALLQLLVVVVWYSVYTAESPATAVEKVSLAYYVRTLVVSGWDHFLAWLHR